jgi:16S rRNA (cytidine1402-2'-O)-methyltransferase
MTGILYLVATPIGNLEDLTLRAIRVLREVDLIVCEDTRVTSKLLAHLEIKKPLLSLHAHSGVGHHERILKELEMGKSVAYVSDAGTPGVNDPGGKLVEIAFERGVTVVPIPGTSALSAAISVCGFPMERFTYVGFIPHKKGRETLFREMSEREEATVFFESTHRIMKTLEQLKSHLSAERLVFVGRELTKMHETLYRGHIDEVIQGLQASSTKGEFVVVIDVKRNA